MHSQTLLQSHCKVKSFQCDLWTLADLSKIRLSPVAKTAALAENQKFMKCSDAWSIVVRFRSNPAFTGVRMLSNFEKPQ